MGLLLLLFIVVPLVDVWLLFRIAELVGGWNTVLLVIVTGALGASLARHEGGRVWGEWKTALAEGRMPEEGVLGGLMVLAGSVMLITPGVITDVAGLLLLMPPTRALALKLVRPWIERKIREGTVQVVSGADPRPTIRVIHFGSEGFGEVFDPFGRAPFDETELHDLARRELDRHDRERSPRHPDEPVRAEILDEGPFARPREIIDADFELKDDK